jgi:transcriptional regulator with XRE-family HTH domain
MKLSTKESIEHLVRRHGVENLRELRFSMGLTQDELADWLGVSKKYYSQVETGRRIPSQLMMMALAYLCESPQIQNDADPEWAKLPNATALKAARRKPKENGEERLGMWTGFDHPEYYESAKATLEGVRPKT